MSRFRIVKSLFGGSFCNVLSCRKVWGMILLNQLIYIILFAGIICALVLAGKICGVEADVGQKHLHHFYQAGEFPVLSRIFSAVTAFFSIFFWLLAGVMLYSEIIRIWNSQQASWRRGWKYALNSIVPVFLWAVLTFAVTAAFGWIWEINGTAGKIISLAARIVWSVLMIMIVPVLARESGICNPFVNIRQAVRLLGRVWREVLIGAVISIILVYLMFSLGLGILAPWIEIARKCEEYRVIAGVIIFSFGGIFIWLGGTLGYLVNAGYLCGTYLLASEGVPPSTDDCDKLL